MKSKNIIICDLDSTLADIDHRLHHIRNEVKKDNHSFHKACVDDKPIQAIIQIVRAMRHCNYEVYIFSCRSDIALEETKAWLKKHEVPYDKLVLQAEGDTRTDDAIKLSWLNDPEIVDRERVFFVLEDRNRVVDMWRREGMLCLQVAPGDF